MIALKHTEEPLHKTYLCPLRVRWEVYLCWGTWMHRMQLASPVYQKLLAFRKNGFHCYQYHGLHKSREFWSAFSFHAEGDFVGTGVGLESGLISELELNSFLRVLPTSCRLVISRDPVDEQQNVTPSTCPWGKVTSQALFLSTLCFESLHLYRKG